MNLSDVWADVSADVNATVNATVAACVPTNVTAKVRTGLKALLLGSLIVGLTACDGRGCFGLCDERDDDDDSDDPVTDPVDPGVDLSCYQSGRTVRREVSQPYATEATGEQILRFYDSSLASSTERRGVLIWVTGDTWDSNNGVSDSPSLAREIAERLGLHFAVVSYRTSSNADWPAQIVDVKTAIRFLKAQNEAQQYNIDIERIFIGGDQAGATLAALGAYTNAFADFEPTEFPEQTDEPDLLIALGGVYNLDTVLANNADRPASCATIDPNINDVEIRRLLDCALPADGASPLAECDAETLRLASPIQQLGPSAPQALIFHGALDCEVPVAQSVELDERYGSGGADSILRGNGQFVQLTDDGADLASLSAQTVLETLVNFPDFDCDDDT